jgi:hypothetical protein
VIIEIDTTKWATPIQYAKLKGVTKQVVNNWIKREKIKTWYIPELDLRLVSKV